MSRPAQGGPKPRAWAGWALLGLLFTVSQFARPIYYGIGQGVYRALFFRPLGAPLEWLEKHIGFQTYHSGFWSKVLLTTLVGGLMTGSLWFFTRSRTERRLVYGLLGAALAGVALANVAGKALGSHWLQTFSRDTLETLTSPFPVLFLLPVLILYRNTGLRR